MNTYTFGRREFIKYGFISSLFLLSGCSTSQKKLVLRGVSDSFPSEFINSLSTDWEFFPMKDINKKKSPYNYVLKENGSNLSGGQRQSISLARALIKKPKILVLDEPTSSMDADTEKLVVENIYNLDYSPTIIIASHKINILTACDKILIIGDGKVLNFGPTNEIIKTQ